MKKKEWRAWAICCDGVGPISTRVYMSLGAAKIAKEFNYAEHELYRVKRVRIVLDEPKRKNR